MGGRVHLFHSASAGEAVADVVSGAGAGSDSGGRHVAPGVDAAAAVALRRQQV